MRKFSLILLLSCLPQLAFAKDCFEIKAIITECRIENTPPEDAGLPEVEQALGRFIQCAESRTGLTQAEIKAQCH